MEILKNLGDGLVLRRTTQADTDALVKLQIHAFANPDTGELDEYIGGWTRDLMSGKHPTFHPDDYFVVEDTKTNALVSCVCLISQTWTMDGISFGVGRPEIVGTLPEYRNRGLVREQFRALHELSAQRGELVQGITGIPYYYRQFGYEYALDLVAQRQTLVPQQIPELKAGEVEKFSLRRATRDDLSFIAELYSCSRARSYIHCERDEKMFEYENFLANDPFDGSASWWDVIETTAGERAGILMHRRYVYGGRNRSFCYELLPQFAWAEVTPFVLRELVRQAQGYENQDQKPLSSLHWILAPNHPLYELMGDYTTLFSSPTNRPYAWYMRVPELPALVKHLAPLFEKRLAQSNLQGLSDALRLNFFKSGLEIIFENGKIKTAQHWRASAQDNGQGGFGNASFPDLTFLKLLFGYCSLKELEAMFPDYMVDTERNSALLNILFPKRDSHVMPI